LSFIILVKSDRNSERIFNPSSAGSVLSKFRFTRNMYFGKYNYTMPLSAFGEYYSFISRAFRVGKMYYIAHMFFLLEFGKID
jgi:hypothetical protein